MILSLNNDQTSQRDANFSVRPTLLYDVVVIKYTVCRSCRVWPANIRAFCHLLPMFERQNGQTMAIYAVFAIWTTPSPWVGVGQYKKPRI